MTGLSNPTSKAIYKKTNRKVQIGIEILDLLMMKLSPNCLLFPHFIVSFYVYFTTDAGRDAFEMQFPVWYDWNSSCSFESKLSNFNSIERLPFDWKTPKGYVISFIFQFILTINLLYSVLCLTILAIGTCLILISLAKDIQCYLNLIKMNARDKRNRRKISKKFTHFIRFHSNSKQLSNNFP